MPHFSSTISDLQAIGPIVDLNIWPGTSVIEALKKSAKPIPEPISRAALIDTGASGTVIKKGTAEELGLEPVGKILINTPSSTGVLCYQYSVQLSFPNRVTVEAVVIEAPLQDQHIQCLIGRDILHHGVLIYIGHTNSFTLSF